MDDIISTWIESGRKKGKKDEFFKKLQIEIHDGVENILIMRDLNGRVVVKMSKRKARNSNEDKIVELCGENNLIISNTKFKHKEIHTFPRVEPRKNQKSIIYYFLIRKKLLKTLNGQDRRRLKVAII